MQRVDALTAKFEPVVSSLEKSSASLEVVMGRLERGEGTAGKLLTDEELFRNMNAAMLNINQATVNINKLSEEIRREPHEVPEAGSVHRYLQERVAGRAPTVGVAAVEQRAVEMAPRVVGAAAPHGQLGQEEVAGGIVGIVVRDFLRRALGVVRTARGRLQVGQREERARRAGIGGERGGQMLLRLRVFPLAGRHRGQAHPRVQRIGEQLEDA